MIFGEDETLTKEEIYDIFSLFKCEKGMVIGMERYFGENTPKLGFGLMRLPKEENGKIDLEQTKKMVDLFLEAGQTYFDTAYTYDNGESELAAKAALVERYPRDAFTLATKINANKEGCDEQSVKQQ